MASSPKIKDPFAAISRNFCNSPFARDERLGLTFRKSGRTGRWLCDAGENLQFRLDSGTPKADRRWPTGFDTHLLFLILSEAKKRGTDHVEFSSVADILKAMGYSAEARNRLRLKRSLALWSAISIWFRKWRIPNVYSYFDKDRIAHSSYRKGTIKELTKAGLRGEKVARQLPPPLDTVKHINRTGLRISVSEEWIEIGQRYFVPIALPLPRDATSQNLLLAVATSRFVKVDDDDETGLFATQPRRVRELCRVIGLNHNNRRQHFRRALAAVRDWYEAQGLSFNWIYRPAGSEKQILFYTRPFDRNDAGRNAEVERLKDQFDAEMTDRGIEFEDLEDAERSFKKWARNRNTNDDESHRSFAVFDDDGHRRQR